MSTPQQIRTAVDQGIDDIIREYALTTDESVAPDGAPDGQQATSHADIAYYSEHHAITAAKQLCDLLPMPEDFRHLYHRMHRLVETLVADYTAWEYDVDDGGWPCNEHRPFRATRQRLTRIERDAAVAVITRQIAA